MDSTSNLLGNMPFKSLETILNSIPSGVVITDTKGRFLYVNARGIDLFGFDKVRFDLAEEFSKIKALKRDGSPFPDNDMPIVNSVRSGEPVRNVEMMIERADSKLVHVLVNSAPLYDANSVIIAAIVTFNDITKQIQTEIELKESEDRYRTLVETTMNAIVVHLNGRFLFLNPAALRLFAAKNTEEIENRALQDFVLRGAQQETEKVVGRTPKGQNILLSKHEVMRLDGVRVPVEAVTGPIRYDGKNATIVIFRDITQQTKLTNQLQDYAARLEQLVEARTKQIVENEKQYHEIYDSFGEALVATDWALKVIHWNKAAERVTTVKAADALGRKVYEVLPEMTNIDISHYFEALQQKKPARLMVNVVSRETKKPSIFEISTYPSSQGIIIIIEDKTEEEQNKRLSAIGATAGMVGHDIRNPLQAIEGDLYLLKDYLISMPPSQTKTDVTESIDEIDKNVSYINKIVADLQDYARQLNPEYAAVNFHDLAEDLIHNTCMPSNIEVTLKVAADFTLKTDPTLVRRAITNLLINAIQAMPTGGKLEVKAQKTDTEAQITISDTGTGIPDEVKPKLFTPMMTTKAKGQGLGLAVVKRLIEALKGSITFESELDKGTEFIIRLPLNQ